MTVVTASLLTPPVGSNHSPRLFTMRCVALIMAIWPPHRADRRFRDGYCFDISTEAKYRAEFDALDAAGWHVTGAQRACFDGLEALGCQRISHRLTEAGRLVRLALCPEAHTERPCSLAARHYAWRLHHQFGDRSRDPRYPDHNPLEMLLRGIASGSLEFQAELLDIAATIGEAACEGNRRGRA